MMSVVPPAFRSPFPVTFITPVCAQMLAVALPKVIPPRAFLIGGKSLIGVNSASWKGSVPTSAVLGRTLPRLAAEVLGRERDPQRRRPDRAALDVPVEPVARLAATKGGHSARSTPAGIWLIDSAKESPGVGPPRLACPIAEAVPSGVVRSKRSISMPMAEKSMRASPPPPTS